MAGMKLSRVKVYDPVLRIIHAWNGLVILLLIVSSQVTEWLAYASDSVAFRHFHLWAGYALILGLVARLVWGLNGPGHARLSAFWQPRAWLTAMRTRHIFGKAEAPGHHPLASAVYIVLYLVLLVMAVSGLALAAIKLGQGPLYPWLGHDVALKAWFLAPHELLEDFVLGFVVLHIAALILHESHHGVPMAQAMVSGYQYREEKEE